MLRRHPRRSHFLFDSFWRIEARTPRHSALAAFSSAPLQEAAGKAASNAVNYRLAKQDQSIGGRVTVKLFI